MGEWIAQNWGSVLLSLVTAGALVFCRWCWKQMKNYRALLEERESEELDNAIEEKLSPILHEIEELRAYIRNVDSLNMHHLNLIIASYRYRLV
jgi:type VI protein secretion system component VasK